MPAVPENPPVRYRIGDLVVDTGSRRVLREGKALKVAGLSFDLLQVLIEAAPAMVSYDELAERVWKGGVASPENIAQRARMLREALSDDAQSPRYVELIRGKGYRLVADVETLDESPPPPARRAVPWVVATLLVIGLLAVWLASFNKPDPAPSVAVLPLADLSEAGDQAYLADGLAEELINQLAQLEGLEVASRTESFTFRNGSGNLQEIGRKLGVNAILEGSVRRSDDEIRVTVQLIDVDSGYHLWSKHFDRELEDIFAIQEEVARAVAGALGVQLGVGAVNEFRGAGTRDIAAYEAYLRGDYSRAMQLDPEYAAAWGLEGVRIASTMWANPPEQAPAIIERAYRHVAKSVELDPQSAQALTTYATIIYVTFAWNEAEASYERALSLRHNADTLTNYGNMLMRVGRSRDAEYVYDERDAMLRVPLQPHFLRINIDIALGKLGEAREKAARMGDESRRFANLAIAFNEESLENVQLAIDEFPANSSGYRELYRPLRDKLATPDEALAFLEELAQDPDKTWPYKYRDIALVAAWLGDAEFAFRVLLNEIVYTTIRYGVLWYPVMSDVRKLPAFKDFARQVNLVDYWRANEWPDHCWPQGEEDFVCE